MKFGIQEYFLSTITLLLVIYYWFTSSFNYWKKLGIPGPRPLPLVGNFGAFLTGKKSLPELIRELYANWKHEPFFGIFNVRMPILIINDLDLVRHILIKDFNVFFGRGITIDEENDALSSNLFNIDGHRWKVIRAKMTPAFTTGKLKQMVTLMVECTNHFEKYLLNNVRNGDVVECREAAAKFTTDVIGSCAFGINMNALSREDSEFRKVGRQIFEPSITNMIKRMLRDFAPKFFKLFGIRGIPKQSIDFFVNTIKETMDIRDKNNIVRNDLVDILLDMKKNQHEINFKLTDGILTSQAFVFFAAGFETSSTTISFGLYELALAPEIQEKLRTEIFDTLTKHNDQLSYESINEMQYLNMVIQETLRKNSPAILLRRQAMKPYNIPGSNITIPAGTKIHIPVHGIHYDEQYYPNPEIFDPERFGENNQKYPMAYLPFGDGPKNCIGARFASYQSKLGIIAVLRHFKIKPSKFTEVPYKINKAAFILTPIDGVRLEFERI